MLVIKPIPNMPGYGASKGGWIYTCKNGKYGLKDTWKRLSPYENKKTHYLTVALRIGYKTVTYTIHQLVALTWIGPVPEGKEVNHIDGVKHNNKASNLEYVTRKVNLILAYAQGLSKIPGTLLTADKVLQIRRVTGKELQSVTAERFGVSPATISDVQTFKSWRHV